MKNAIKAASGILALGILTFTACKKKEDDSVKGKLAGKWTLTAIATDDNNNGVEDASERSNWPDSLVVTITFNGDGTGSSTDLLGSGSNSFTWKLINSDADVEITRSASDVSTSHIISLSKSDVVFKDTDTAGGVTHTNWSYWKK